MKNRFILSATLIILFFSCSGNKNVNNVWEGTAYGIPQWELSEAQQPEHDAIEKLLYENVVIENGRFVFTADRDDVTAAGLPDSYYERFLDYCKGGNRIIKSQHRRIKKLNKEGVPTPSDDIRDLWKIECEKYAASHNVETTDP